MKKPALIFILNDALQFYKRTRSSRELKKGAGIKRLSERMALERTLESVKSKAYTKIGDLDCTAYVTDEPVPFASRFKGKKIELAPGVRWAEKVFDCAWFHITGNLPQNVPMDRVVFLIDTAGEGLIYDVDGNPKQGITNYASQFDYRLGLPGKKVVINDNLSSKGRIEFFIDCGANDLFGNMKNKSEIQQLDIALVNPEIRALGYDLEVLLSVYDYNADDSYILGLYQTLRKVASQCKDLTEEKAAALRKELKPYLDNKNDGPVFRYTAIGHSHLDLAWLWPIRETKRKGARTFCNQIVNLKRYPGYIFGASQAQLYDWMKTNYPDIYEKIKALQAEGRWELQGATWVEMDTNLISGESLIRQFFYGLKYFREEFGEDMKILWLPDSFGYSACIPQVMKLADVPYFLTQKMSWNTVNKFPYHTFIWKGLDGSAVFAHMLPEDTYNAPVRGEMLKFGEKNFRERAISGRAMSLFGIGDGGGGPGFEHLERAVRLKDIKGMPKYEMGTAKSFFDEVSAEAAGFPVHNGELYLEKHQGTYTTQSNNKKMNRRCEILLRNYEMMAAAAAIKGLQLPISKEELEAIWKEVFLYQFHDILPGSSINRVYEETKERYAVLVSKLTAGIDILLNALVKGQGVANFNSFSYDLPIKINDIWYRVQVPALGCTGLSPEMAIETFYAKADDNSLENDRVRVTFEKGFIVSLYDKTLQREFVKKGHRFNLFTLYKDYGNCWDIRPVNYRHFGRNVSCVSFNTGTDGAKAFAIVLYTVGAVRIKQEISILDGSALVSFDTDIDTTAKSSMLRVAFPLNIQTEECKFNVQFGHISRRTTEKDSIEKAQFEVSGQKFADMSEADCGLSVINNCKYGFRCKHGVIDMNMIRSPLMGPGRDVDHGHNHFRYAVLPHPGPLSYITYKEAYLFNCPLSVVRNGLNKAETKTNFFTDNPNIIVEAAKAADDGNGMIAHMYNCSETPVKAVISSRGFKAESETGILENPLRTVDGNTLTFGKFELKIVRFVRTE
jgi:alpha-mannosidase